MSISPSEWEWHGTPGHFIGAHDCHFHLTTVIGDRVISTVGEYAPRHAIDAHGGEGAFWAKNPCGIEIGNRRYYETMVFRLSGRCPCGCGHPMIDGTDIDFLPSDSRQEARRNHMGVCKKYS